MPRKLFSRSGMILTILLIGMQIPLLAQKTAYVSITMHGVESQEALFGRLKGSIIVTLDTVSVVDGTVNTVVENPLRGVYRLQYNDSLYLEFLIASDSVITLETDVNDIFGKMVVNGSPDNQIYFHYWQYKMATNDSLNLIATEASVLMQASDGGRTPVLDSLQKVYNDIYRRQQTHIYELLYLYNGWFATTLIKAFQQPSYQYFLSSGNEYLTEQEFYRTHFFDNIDFSDDGLLNSEVYYVAINDYLANFAKPPGTQTYMAACTTILETAKGHPAFYDYALNLLVQNFEYTVWENVFARLVEKYYLGYENANPAMADYYRRKAKAIRTLQPGNQAPPVVLPDTAGNILSLDKIAGRLKVLVFWSAECDHCEEIMPDLKQLYDTWHPQGLTMIAVSVDDDKQTWLDGIHRNHTEAWTHLSELKGLGGDIAPSYNIWMTPVIYILDWDNNIITRPYSVEVLKQEVEKILGGK